MIVRCLRPDGPVDCLCAPLVVTLVVKAAGESRDLHGPLEVFTSAADRHADLKPRAGGADHVAASKRQGEGGPA